ncbi:MAG: DUF4293 domain-containing protein [Dysgonamonadaceae bacterium]|jgi:hypothetical protein|nr:DUF4293 domain-containing protein [Dysgonamonadaceae bacterium]
MLQRIQTLYLLLITALTIAMLFLPLAVVQADHVYYSFDASGMSTTIADSSELVFPAWALMVLSAIIALLAIITVFLYKKRILQIRLCIFNAFLLIGFYGLVAFFLCKVYAQSELFHLNARIALTFPLISLILDYLAIRNIGADEALVRSLDRLR